MPVASASPLRIVVAIGSMRANSNTARAAAALGEALRAAHSEAVIDVIDPRRCDLRVPGAPGADAAVAALTADLQARVKGSDGVVLVTPEYDGSYSAVLKLIIEYLGYPSMLDGKPVALLGVAAGAIGAERALDHLRALCWHIGAEVVPCGASLASVHAAFDAAGRMTDAASRRAVQDLATGLVAYLERRCPR